MSAAMPGDRRSVAGDRPLSELLQDILGNLRDIVRFEVRLAKTEVRAEAAEAAVSLAWIAAGGVAVLGAGMLLLWAAVYALALRVDMWLAVLIVAAVVGVAGVLVLAAGRRRLKRVRPVPERTINSIKEDVEWLKPSTR
jgi:Putative Actinobacterial Holin-X, holin superfamily III